MVVSILLLLLALLLGAAVGTGLAWVFWIRPRASHAARGRQPALWRSIAVPIVDRRLPEAALRTAARLSLAKGGRVVVLVPVQVPRTMNLEAVAPPGLDSAIERLEAAEAFVRRLGAEVHGEVVRGREIGDFVGRACQEAGVQVVVIEPDPASRATGELVRALVDARAPGHLDVVIARHPPASS